MHYLKRTKKYRGPKKITILNNIKRFTENSVISIILKS